MTRPIGTVAVLLSCETVLVPRRSPGHHRSMSGSWSERELQLIDRARELDIAVRRGDGTLRRWTPIWVVRADDRVYVRTWYRRDTGWFGAVLRSGRARIRVPGLEAEAVVTEVGELRERVDAAYRDKYGDAGSASMVGDEAAATTLRLDAYAT
jgi:hypothetical protein